MTDGLLAGPFRLTREIGRGGMGSVWLAERHDGTYAQRVAVKLIRPGLSGGTVMARFQRERRILASLQHPSIARLLDAGTTGDGRPYLAMEYVEGVPITEFVDDRMPTRAIVQLFLSVCDAVAYAHRNLVVHRDLKPGNCLVTAEGLPKLLDFGIAKLLETDGDGTVTTDAPAFTPEYASPEQVRGEPITTAADVYALGLLLHELLSGDKAQPVTASTPIALHEAICEREPSRPSQLAGPRAKDVRGDLDAIVAKALRKEPDQRYAGAADLADDLRRSLADEPVRARKGTLAYRAQRFARRNRRGLAAGALVVLSLVSALAFATHQSRARAREAARAERGFARVRKLATSFLFDIDDQIGGISGTTEARALVVQKAVEQLDSLYAEAGDDLGLKRELVAAYVRVGRVQGLMDNANLGLSHEALRSIRRALSLLESIPGWEEDPELLRTRAGCRLDLGVVLTTLGRSDEAERALSLAIASADASLARKVTVGAFGVRGSALNRLGDVLLTRGDPAAALLRFRRALEPFQGDVPRIEEVRLGMRPTTLARIALASRELGDLEGALASFEEAIAGIDALSLNPHFERMTRCELEGDIARTLLVGDRPCLGRAEEAVRRATHALAVGRSASAEDPKDSEARVLYDETVVVAAEVYDAAGRPAEALALLKLAEPEGGAAAERSDAGSESSAMRVRWAIATAVSLSHVSRNDESEAVRRGTIDTLREPATASTPRSDSLFTARVRLGDVLLARKDAPGAARLYEEALAGARAGVVARPARPLERFFVAEAAERLANVVGSRADRCALLSEARALWTAWKAAGLTASYADGRLQRLQSRGCDGAPAP